MPSRITINGSKFNDLGSWGNKYDFTKGLQNYHRFELNGYKELLDFEINIMDKLYKIGGKEVFYKDYVCNNKGEIIKECKEFYKYDLKGNPLNENKEIIKLN
tara:strand:+ start:72 stop:377 length:306 start_codon:yes stop_codon:yes gene_type:complete